MANDRIYGANQLPTYPDQFGGTTTGGNRGDSMTGDQRPAPVDPIAVAAALMGRIAKLEGQKAELLGTLKALMHHARVFGAFRDDMGEGVERYCNEIIAKAEDKP